MKECPRCGSSLSHYALSDVEAYGCDGCGWVGIDVEHRSEPVRIESWQDAIRRFHQQFTDSELDEHAENLSRVEAERQAALGEAEETGEAATDPEADAGPSEESEPDDDETDSSEAEVETTEDETEPADEGSTEDAASVESAAADAVEDAGDDDGTDDEGDAETAPETAAPANSQAE